MRNLSYWETRGYPKSGPTEPKNFRGFSIVLTPSMLAGLSQAQQLEVIGKAIEAGMGCKPMKAKRS